MKKRTYHRDRCNAYVRATIENNGTIITLMGQHAFEWSIVTTKSGNTVITTFPNGSSARKEWRKLINSIK